MGINGVNNLKPKGERIVKVEVRVKTTNPDLDGIVEKIRREMELAFGDAASIGYVEKSYS